MKVPPAAVAAAASDGATSNAEPGSPSPTIPPPLSEVSFGGYCFDLEREELRRGENFIRLTAGEVSLLKALARQPGVPVSRDDLAANSPIVGSARTVDVQMTRLRRKIEPNPKYPRFLQTVRGTGYVLLPD